MISRRRFGSVSHMHEADGGSGVVREDYQTLDYDIDESTLFQQELQRKPLAYRRRLNLMRWLICMGVGVTTGALAFVIDWVGENLFAFKFALAANAATAAHGAAGSSFRSWTCGLLATVGVNLLFVSVACGLVLFVSPIAGGSGIPEVKAYLQVDYSPSQISGQQDTTNRHTHIQHTRNRPHTRTHSTASGARPASVRSVCPPDRRRGRCR